MRFDRDNLPVDSAFREHVKVGTTRIAGPFPPPVEVLTREGEYLVSQDPAYLALDADGNPYPIAADVFERTYRDRDEHLEALARSVARTIGTGSEVTIKAFKMALADAG